MQRNSTTGSVSPEKTSHESGQNRIRTYGGNSSRDSTGGGTVPSRGLNHYRSSSARMLTVEEDYDPLLMASLERPALEDEAENVSLFHSHDIHFCAQRAGLILSTHPRKHFD
jgi:hypothetical protein